MGEALALQGRIARVFAETMNVQVPSVETDLFGTGALDSLGFVDLLVGLEQEFGIKIPIEDIDIENFRCIEKIAAFVANRKGSSVN